MLMLWQLLLADWRDAKRRLIADTTADWTARLTGPAADVAVSVGWLVGELACAEG